jgi:hypothetical protein
VFNAGKHTHTIVIWNHAARNALENELVAREELLAKTIKVCQVAMQLAEGTKPKQFLVSKISIPHTGSKYGG